MPYNYIDLFSKLIYIKFIIIEKPAGFPRSQGEGMAAQEWIGVRK